MFSIESAVLSTMNPSMAKKKSAAKRKTKPAASKKASFKVRRDSGIGALAMKKKL
jgi:hypothetical protein